MNEFKLSKRVRNRLPGLLNMSYRPEELANKLETDQATIEACIKLGCPYDGEWINGLAFREWAKDPRLPKSQLNTHINRQNWLDIETYLSYVERAHQLDPRSVKVYRLALKRLLLWAGDQPLPEAPSMNPAFPAFLAKGGIEKNKISSFATTRSCDLSRLFFRFAQSDLYNRYNLITDRWIETLQVSRRNGAQSTLRKRIVFDLESVRKVIEINPQSLREKRVIAAVAFLFLSGMRVDAFLSMPIRCFDIDRLTVNQLPEEGVRTKFHKAAITGLFTIPDLLKVVKEWDSFVRTAARPDALWYIPLAPFTNQILGEGKSESLNRSHNLRRDLRLLCAKYDLPYMSPHKLRHGHAVYGIKHAKDMKELKAVSQNLMHSSISITDGIYGRLTAEDVNQTIANLGNNDTAPANDQATLLIQAITKLINNPELLQKIAGS